MSKLNSHPARNSIHMKALAFLVSLAVVGCAGGGGGGAAPPSATSAQQSTGGASGSGSAGTPGFPTIPLSLAAPTGSYQTNLQLEQTNYRYAHSAGVTGTGITVAVVDTGVQAHSKLGARLVNGIDAVGGTNNGKEDADGHGTHVAGIIGAAIEGGGSVGVAPGVNIAPIRIFDSSGNGSTAAFKDGILASAWLNARIYNISLGTSGTGPIQSVEDSLTWLKTNGKLAIVAAGNDGAANPGYPATSLVNMAGNLIVVGALDGSGNIASYSNKAGSTKEYFLVAPGSGIVSLSNLSPTSYSVKSGTSMAAPVVAGAAALAWSYWPYLQAAQVSDILFKTAKDLGAAGIDEVYGRGLVDIKAALSPIGTLALTSTQGVSVVAGQPIVTAVGSTGAAIKAASISPVYFDYFKRSFSLPLSQAVAVAKENYAEGVSQGLATMLQATEQSRTAVSSNFSMRAQLASRTYATDPALNYSFQLGSKAGAAHLFGGAEYLPFAQTGYFKGKAAFAGAEALKNPYLQWTSNPQGFGFSSELKGAMGGVLTFGSVNGKDKLGDQLNTNLAEMRWSGANTQATVQLGQQSGNSAFVGLKANGANSATSFVSLSGSFQASPGLWAHSSFTAGQATTAGSDILTGGRAATQAMSFGLVKDGAFSDKDSLGFSVTLPNRVVSGTAYLTLPTSVTSEGAAGYTTVPVSLQPTGRESVLEFAWTTPLSMGAFGFSVARRVQPSHDAYAEAINVFALRFQKRF